MGRRGKKVGRQRTTSSEAGAVKVKYGWDGSAVAAVLRFMPRESRQREEGRRRTRTGEGCRITRYGANNGDATGISSKIFLSLPPSFHFPSKDDPLLKVWYSQYLL